MKRILCVAVFLIVGIAALKVHTVSFANNLEEHIVDIDTPQSLPNLIGSDPKVSEDGNIGIDTSYVNTSGCITAMYKKDVKGRLFITKTNGKEYLYALPNDGKYHSFPCSDGNGEYSLKIYTYAGHDNAYVLGLSEKVTVNLTDSMAPYLTSNIWCPFDEDSLSTSVATRIATKHPSEEDFVDEVYEYVTSNITYDQNKTKDLSFGYYPNVDSTLTEKEGICIDYTAVMAAMLRCMGIPTKICFGYVANGDYHAWIEVFNSIAGKWDRYDPTAGANNSKTSTTEYVSNDNNYQTTYVY